MMKRLSVKMKIIIVIVFVFLLISLIYGRISDNKGNIYKPEDFECSIYFPKEVINISGLTPDAFGKELVNASEGRVIFISGQDNSVTMYMDNSTRIKLIESRKQLLNELGDEFENLGQGYYVKISKEFDQLEIAFDPKMSPVKVIDYVMYADFLCACAQILESNNGEGWDILITIKDSRNRKVITSGHTKDGSITYTGDDWDKAD